MTNIDSRLINEVTPNEFFLLNYLANMMNCERMCYPGNKKLCNDLKWSLPRLQDTKRSLAEKGFIEVRNRSKENSKGQASNYYFIKTPLISNYTPGKKDNTGDVINIGTPPVKEFDRGPVMIHGTPPVKKHDNEVLVTEELTTEELESEELEKEKRRALFFSHSVFEKIIECFFPDYKEHTIGRYGDEPKQEDLDSVTYSILKNSWGAAEKILAGLKTINRDIEPYRRNVYNGPDETKDPEGDALQQVEAYADFCRLTGMYLTKNLEKLPEKICSGDWCAQLLKYAQDPKNKYDAAMDEELLSNWLLEVSYVPVITYLDKNNDDRMVWAGLEYYYK